MAGDKVDYAAILADAEAKKAALERYIDSLKEALAAGALGQPGEVAMGSFSASSSITGGSIELPVGAFLGKSVPAAIKLYLSTIKRKQTTSQIANALREGGIESTADNFEQVVAGALFRLKHAGEVLRFQDGWGFAEHYPEHIRKAVAADGKPARKKSKRAKATSKKSSKSKAQVVPITQGLEQLILTILTADKAKSHSPVEVANALGVNATGVTLTLGRMAAKHIAEKCNDGKYKAVSNAQKAVN